MDELNSKERLFEFWMIYSSKLDRVGRSIPLNTNQGSRYDPIDIAIDCADLSDRAPDKTDVKALQDYIHLFVETYSDLVDYDLKHLNEGFSEEGPHLTTLPDGILQVFGNQMNQARFSDDLESIATASNLLKCLIIICRNYDNVPLVASCEFLSYSVSIASVVVEKLRDLPSPAEEEVYSLFLKLVLHFFECLYDPYFMWRKRLLGRKVDNTRLKFKPAFLHVEIIPFFHDCFQKKYLGADIKVRLIHVFGAIISGSLPNSLKAITPATLDVLLRILGNNEGEKPTNEQRQEMAPLRDLVLKCMVRMVHVIHCCSPDQRQVEVSQVMEGYMQVILETDTLPDNETDTRLQLSMIGAISEMLTCQDKSALQVIMISGGTFDSFISLLQKTSLCGAEAQGLAMSILNVMRTVLAGSGNAKERFRLRVGYDKFLEVLKSLGQPSVELLKSVLNLVVEGEFKEKTAAVLHNTHAAIMLIHWLPDIQSHDLQDWLSEHLRWLCCAEHNNKMNCCNDGMIGAILMVLGRERQINQVAVSHLIGLLESLGTQSVTAIELKQLIGLLRLNEESNQNPYCSRLMRAMSTMARREGKEGALHFFNIQQPTDGLLLPGIRKWPGHAFAVHAWFCLDVHPNICVHNVMSSQPYRRVLYSFLSNSGSGFEAFITVEGHLVIAVFNKKDYATAVVPDVDLADGAWHSVCVVHTNSKRPFVTSQLNVYIDGKQELNSQLRYPNMTEPLTSCRIGSQVHSNHNSDVTNNVGCQGDSTKKMSPFRSLLQSATKSNGSVPGVESIAVGSQDDMFGPPVTLNGQVGSVCIFHELVSLQQVKVLYTAGPNNLVAFTEEAELQDLPGKMLLHYNARACKDSHIMDLSTNQNHGQLSGQKCVTYDIKDVINCIGGIQVLFPLLEQVNKLPEPPELKSPDFPLVTALNKIQEKDDWVVVPSSSYADTKLEQNQVAGFLTLLRNMVQTKPVNQHTFVQTNGAAVIGALLQKANPKLIDVHVLMAVQLLVEATAASSKTLVHHLYQYILFDFRIWSRSDFPVRIGHIQYLSTIIKDDRRQFRKMFGVQYILDVIRLHYSSSCELTEEDAKMIRVSLFGLVKFYIVKEITHEELSSLLNFMLVCLDENMICEALDILVSLLENTRKQDQLFLLMFEPEMAEMLYALLTIKAYTIVYYEKIVKVLYILLKTEKVYEKNKTRLRLLDCGYLGLINLIQGFEVSGPTIKRFLEQVSITDTPQSYNAVLAVLQLIYTSGFDIKLEASRQLLSILVSKNGAAKSFAKQLGWQEVLTKLFILQPIAMETDNGNHGDDCDITMVTDRPDGVNGLPDGCAGDDALACGDSEKVNLLNSTGENGAIMSNSTCVHSEGESSGAGCTNCDRTDVGLSENGASVISNGSGDSGERKLTHPSSLDLTPLSSTKGKEKVDFYTPIGTPTTPLYLKTYMYDDLNNSASDDEFRAVSRSSSASAEDLSTIAQRAAESKSQEAEEAREGRATPSSSSLSQMSQSESGLELDLSAEALESRRNSLSSSRLNNAHRMLDSLGLRGSFLMETVEDSEELIQNLLIVLYTVMWKGVEGSKQAAWKERGQVFTWLDYISDTNTLICTKEEIKRRLLEMMLHACATESRDSGHTSQSDMENAAELIRLVRHFLAENNGDSTSSRFNEMLLEDVMTLLDSLAVWDIQTGGGWQEMAHLGLSILLAFACQPNLQLCASATARLHMLVQTKLISSSAEAAYLIGHLNDMIVRAVSDQTDNYSFLTPVMKALMEKSQQLLNLDINLPSLSATAMSPTFFDDFKTYCYSQEWTTFMENYIDPQKLHFMEDNFMDSVTKTSEFWTECKEETMLNMHKRNRESGESKLKFQSQVLTPFNKKVSTEQRRFHNVITQQGNQHQATLRQWRATKRFFTGERGAWAERQIAELHWKLSNQENFCRMKVKLIQNYNFDLHREASRQRDNMGVDSIDGLSDIKSLAVSKEALVSKENIADDAIGDEEWSVISSSSSVTEEYQDKEKLVLSEECELVTLVDVISGRLEVTTTHVYFFDCSSAKEEGGEDFKWSLSQLREIHFRRYNLRRSALELFLIDQTNYFLNFQKKVRNKVYSRILSLRPPNLIYYGSRSPAELLKASGLMQKWINREISNFEYLMQLNTIAGRTYNDLSQYPVFPWILSDYTSESLDLNNPDIFRDLSKPIGVLNPDNEQDVREKFENFEDPSGEILKFHYGTHYSNAATVMHYLIRMEPFTTLHIALQSGRFDVADRQFHSIPGTWSSMYNNTNDVKELIPEFFYLPEFLINSNEFDLGTLQLSKEGVNNVHLPPWATSPEDFIDKHRKALESEYVSANLHNWIDLIFGYKQKGPAAEEALNIFYYCTYEGAVDLDNIQNPVERKAVEGMINNFGQTPCQLLKEAHPRRLTFDEISSRALKADRHLSITHFLEQLKVYFVEVSAETDPLAYVAVPRSQTRSIIQHGMPDTMVTVSTEGIVGTHGWLPYDKSISNYFTFEKDPSVSNPKTRKKYSCPFAPGLKVEAKLFVVSHDAKLLFSGGHWDNSLQVYHIGKGKKISHICRHIDVVTCLALDYCGSHLITGSRDTTCMIWQVIQQGGVSQSISTKPLQTLYGHDAEVTAVHISTELDLAVSASKDQTVMIHTVRKGHYMRTLRPEVGLGYNMTIPMLAVDDMGHIAVYTHESYPIDPKALNKLHLYSLNGKHIQTNELDHNVGHMIVKGEHLIIGDTHGNLTVYETFGLCQQQSLPLYVPVHCLSLTNGNSHLLAGLRDGKLIIVGIKSKSEIR